MAPPSLELERHALQHLVHSGEDGQIFFSDKSEEGIPDRIGAHYFKM